MTRFEAEAQGISEMAKNRAFPESFATKKIRIPLFTLKVWQDVPS